MRDVPFWFRPVSAVWQPAAVSRSGGRSIGGSEQVVQSDAGYWTCQMDAPVHGEVRTLAWNAFLAQARGRSGEFLVPCIRPWRPHDQDGQMFSPDYGELPEPHGLFGLAASEPETMWIAEDAPLRASRITVRHPHVEGLRPGHHFGIGDRLYLVSDAWQTARETVPEGGAVTYGGAAVTYDSVAVTYGGEAVIVGENVSEVEFWPPLREAIPAETPLKLARPVCKMRLASDDSGALDQPYGIAGTVTVDFVEVF